MPLCLCRPRMAVRRVVLPPLQLMASPYQHWLARRAELRAIDAERRRIAEETRAELAGLHERLWDYFPAAVDEVRTRVQTRVKEEHRDG